VELTCAKRMLYQPTHLPYLIMLILGIAGSVYDCARDYGTRFLANQQLRVLRARWVTSRARWVTLRARWVTLRARWVTPRARWVTLRARWVTLRARWVTFRADDRRRGADGRGGELHPGRD
jgi:hypothetical protein